MEERTFTSPTEVPDTMQRPLVLSCYASSVTARDDPVYADTAELAGKDSTYSSGTATADAVYADMTGCTRKNSMYASVGSTDDVIYVEMNGLKRRWDVGSNADSTPYKTRIKEDHYKVPAFPRPVSTFRSHLPVVSAKRPPLPSSLSPRQRFLRSQIPISKPVSVPVKPPCVPDFVARPPAVMRTVTKIDISDKGVCKTSTVTTPACDEMKKVLDELSDLINSSTDELMNTSMTTEVVSTSTVPSATPPPPPPPPYTSWPMPSPPISQDLESLSRKINSLVINVQAQNKKIDEIRRACAGKGSYLSFDELEDGHASSSDEGARLVSRRSTLPYSSGEGHSKKGSWGKKLISCVRFGKNNK